MTPYLNTMLTSPDAVKAESQINYNVDDNVIGASIRTAQSLYLQEIIGSELLKKLQLLVFNAINKNEDNIDDDENAIYKDLLDDYVEPLLIAQTLMETCVPISMKIRNIGVSQDNDYNIVSAQLTAVKELRDYYETHCDHLATRLSQYLCHNKELFPELSAEDCGCGIFIKPSLGKEYGNTGLWLGGNNNDCKCGKH